MPQGTVDFITSAWSLEAGIALDHGVHCREVRVAGVGGRGAHRHEQQPSVLERVGELGGEVQALGVARQQLLQAGLVDRNLAAAQALDLGRVDVHAPHLAAQLGEAGGGHQPDIAGADHSDWLLAGAHESGKASG